MGEEWECVRRGGKCLGGRENKREHEKGFKSRPSKFFLLLVAVVPCLWARKKFLQPVTLLGDQGSG